MPQTRLGGCRHWPNDTIRRSPAISRYKKGIARGTQALPRIIRDDEIAGKALASGRRRRFGCAAPWPRFFTLGTSTLVPFCQLRFLPGAGQHGAPLYPLLLILTLHGFEWLRSCDPVKKPAGLFLTRAMPAATLAKLALPIFSVISGSPFSGKNAVQATRCTLQYDKLRLRLRQ